MMRNMDKGILTNADMKQRKYKLLYTGIILFLVIYTTILCVLPVVWVILSGFKNAQELYRVPAPFLPETIDLSKLLKVWKELKFYEYYANTFTMAGGAVLLNITFSGLAGYVLSKLKPKGSGVVFKIFFWVMLLPGGMGLIPLYKSFIDFPVLHVSLIGTYWPIWLMAVNVFDIILFKNFFDGISTQIVEAARIDGANDVRIFTKILLPLSMPICITVAIFTFNGQFGQFLWPLLVLGDEKTTVGVQLYHMKSGNYTMDYHMLALLFSIIPQAVVYAIFQKRIIGGINVGGVKG